MRSQRFPPRPERALLVYVAGAALWYAATGMQQVLFSWLVVGELRASPQTVGVVQMAGVLPILLLLLLAGAAADRLDRRRLLIGAHLLAAVLVALLAGAVAAGRLSLALLLVYAAAMGCIGAFALPARDAMLSDVARDDLTRAATALTLAQFGAQALGNLAAGTAGWLGLAPALGAQAFLLAAGTAAAFLLPASRAHDAGRSARPRLPEVLAGVTEVSRSPVLRSTILLMAGIGLFLSGAYFVVVPVLIRDHYRGGVEQLSLFMGVLQGGTVLGACALLVARRLARRGRVLVLGLAGSALCMLALALGPPFAPALATALAWGLCVAGFQSVGRAIVQEAAPQASRARVLSVHSLGVMGAGVVGAPLAGALAGALGPRAALGVAAATMLAFVTAVATATRVWRVE